MTVREDPLELDLMVEEGLQVFYFGGSASAEDRFYIYCICKMSVLLL